MVYSLFLNKLLKNKGPARVDVEPPPGRAGGHVAHLPGGGGVCSPPQPSPVSLPAEEFQALLKRLPDDRFLNSTAISQFWVMDSSLQHRYQQMGASLKVLFKKAYRIVRRLFNLCKRCHRQPRFRLPKER